MLAAIDAETHGLFEFKDASTSDIHFCTIISLAVYVRLVSRDCGSVSVLCVSLVTVRIG
jgi:hypothetical protein